MIALKDGAGQSTSRVHRNSYVLSIVKCVISDSTGLKDREQEHVSGTILQ